MRLDSSTGWPLLDFQRRHVRTLGGSFIPFYVLETVALVVTVVVAIEATFGLSNWLSIPACIFAVAWAIEAVDIATVAIRSDEYDRREQHNT